MAGPLPPEGARPAPGPVGATGRQIARSVGAASAVQTFTMLPMFLVGALAVQIRTELAFGPALLGAVTASFVLSRAVTSVGLGGLVDRLGAITSLRVAAAGAALVTLVIALFARNWLSLLLCMLTAGAVQAMAQPAANRLLSRAVPARRLGFAFGVKQSGPPLAISFAGLAVPLIALSVGWRWAFALAAVLATGAVFLVPSRAAARAASGGRQPAVGDREGVGLVALAIGLAFTLGTVNSLTTFLVDSAVDVGVDPGRAGWLMTLGGLGAITSRLTIGLLADRMQSGHLRVVALMLVLGVPGLVLVSTGRPWLVGLGAFVTYSMTWGVNGLFFFALVRANPSMPGAASGRVIAGGSIGGFAAPAIFGFVVEAAGYPVAWLMAAGWASLGAVAVSRAHVALSRPLDT